jgi:glycosyltransferase involved in cell wall biosynthesis
MPKKLLYIAPALPVLTCTFIYREIFDLRSLGFYVDTVSMNTPAGDRVSDEARELLDTTLYLDQVGGWDKLAGFLKSLILRPAATLRCLKLWATAQPMKSFRDYQRLGYHLVEACYLSFEFERRRPDHIHSHFITGATSIGMFLSELLDVPFSFTMHASAIWIDPIALKTKLHRCRFCVSISDYNKRYVTGTYGQEWDQKINVVHCGISMAEVETLPARNQESGAPVSVLAVGQLMKRKGYHVLIEAARILRDRNVDISWTIVGEGNQRQVLEDLIRRYELHDVVHLLGARPHEDIPQFIADSDIFTLPCVIGDDETRDGIPVALMEAMAWRLPVVSTNIVGLPELIASGHDGILVESGNADLLANAIEELASSAELRARIGNAAVDKIDREFNAARSARQLAALFDTGFRAST